MLAEFVPVPRKMHVPGQLAAHSLYEGAVSLILRLSQSCVIHEHLGMLKARLQVLGYMDITVEKLSRNRSTAWVRNHCGDRDSRHSLFLQSLIGEAASKHDNGSQAGDML